jgi:peptidyl-prolyl cis-trans isomerase B (cyclophilin B)
MRNRAVALLALAPAVLLAGCGGNGFAGAGGTSRTSQVDQCVVTVQAGHQGKFSTSNNPVVDSAARSVLAEIQRSETGQDEAGLTILDARRLCQTQLDEGASNTKPSPRPVPSTALPGGGPCGYTSDNSGQAARPASLPPTDPPRTGKYAATLVTNEGTVQFDLLTDKAPCAVSSFRSLASSGYFNDTPCHRLVVQPQFGVLQCGDPSGTGEGGPGYTFKDENLTGATYPAGTVAMANSGPDTDGSQFFLVYTDTQLAPSYTPFGHITSGLDVLQKVARGGVNGPGGDGPPQIPVQLQKVTVSAG